MMLYVFNAWDKPALFQAGWFVESLLTQTLIIHIIRTARIPFLESRASTPLIMTTVIIVAIGAVIPYTLVGDALGFVPLPALYWPLVVAMSRHDAWLRLADPCCEDLVRTPMGDLGTPR
jgi:Mg2+-importing ATPase